MLTSPPFPVPYRLSFPVPKVMHGQSAYLPETACLSFVCIACWKSIACFFSCCVALICLTRSKGMSSFACVGQSTHGRNIEATGGGE